MLDRVCPVSADLGTPDHCLLLVVVPIGRKMYFPVTVIIEARIRRGNFLHFPVCESTSVFRETQRKN